VPTSSPMTRRSGITAARRSVGLFRSMADHSASDVLEIAGSRFSGHL
jgi:hypothetical protein